MGDALRDAAATPQQRRTNSHSTASFLSPPPQRFGKLPQQRKSWGYSDTGVERSLSNENTPLRLKGKVKFDLDQSAESDDGGRPRAISLTPDLRQPKRKGKKSRTHAGNNMMVLIAGTSNSGSSTPSPGDSYGGGGSVAGQRVGRRSRSDTKVTKPRPTTIAVTSKNGVANGENGAGGVDNDGYSDLSPVSENSVRYLDKGDIQKRAPATASAKWNAAKLVKQGSGSDASSTSAEVHGGYSKLLWK